VFFGLPRVPSFHNELRDEGLAKFSAREEEVKLMQTQYKQMQMRLLSTEKAYAGLEENARYEYHNFLPSVILTLCYNQSLSTSNSDTRVTIGSDEGKSRWAQHRVR
jgi:hypothetical protein